LDKISGAVVPGRLGGDPRHPVRLARSARAG